MEINDESESGEFETNEEFFDYMKKQKPPVQEAKVPVVNNDMEGDEIAQMAVDVVGVEEEPVYENMDGESFNEDTENEESQTEEENDYSEKPDSFEDGEDIKEEKEEDSEEEVEEKEEGSFKDNDEGLGNDLPDIFGDNSSSVYNPVEESAFYNAYEENQDNSIVEDLLGNGGDGENGDDDDEDDDIPKVDFATLQGKGNKSGKLNKNLVIIFLLSFLAVLFIIVGITRLKKNQKLKEQVVNEELLDVEGYTSGFGDYKARQHKQTEKEKEEEELDYAKKLLENGDKEFVADGNNNQGNYKEEYQGVSQAGGNTGGNGNVTGGNSGGSDAWKNAVESPIAKGGSGFGSKKSMNEGNFLVDAQGSSQNQYRPVSGGYEDIASYLSQSQGNKENSTRYTENGRYDENQKGGTIKLISENSLYPGTVLPAVLVSGINTDYPGSITARIISPVYDSKTGKTLLIPQGSILRGSYSSSSIGVSRVQIAWTELIINRDGIDYVVTLGSMNGVDKKGYSGIRGTLNDHAFEYVKAAGLSCLFTFINSNIYTYSNRKKNTTLKQMIGDAQDIGNDLSGKILDRALDIEPTVIVKPGTRVNVDVNQILTLVPFKNDQVKNKYERR